MLYISIARLVPFCQWCFSAGAAGEHQKSLQSSAALRLNHSWHGPDEPLISDTFSLCDFYWCVGKKRQIELPPDRSTNCFRKSSKHLSPSPSLSMPLSISLTFLFTFLLPLPLSVSLLLPVFSRSFLPTLSPPDFVYCACVCVHTFVCVSVYVRIRWVVWWGDELRH